MRNQFSKLLDSLAGGKVANELSERLEEVVKAVVDTRKQGSITVTLKLSMPTSEGDAIKITPVLGHKPPEFEQPESIRWVNEKNNLLMNAPDIDSTGSIVDFESGAKG